MSPKKPNSEATTTSSQTSKDIVWVGKSDEAKSCDKDKGIELDKMEIDLKNSGVTILNKKKVHDDQMRIQMCGADKGTMNGFQIDKKFLDKATQLGFKYLGTNINE